MIKTTTIHHFGTIRLEKLKSVTSSVKQGYESKQPSDIIGGKYKFIQPFGKQLGITQ